MVALQKEPTGDTLLIFWCQGCETHHGPRVDGKVDGRQRWVWNHDRVRPTLSPSVVTRLSETDGRLGLCHLFLKNGVLEYLSDCTHALAGQQVPLTAVEWAE